MRLFVFSFLFLFPFAGVAGQNQAVIKANKELCQSEDQKFVTDGPTDPCAEFQINRVASAKHLAATSAHAATAAICWAQTVTGSNVAPGKVSPCDKSDKVTAYGDEAGGIAVAIKAKDVSMALTETTTMAAGLSANKLGKKNEVFHDFTETPSNEASLSDERSDAVVQNNDKNPSENEKTSVNSGRIKAISNTLQSVQEVYNYHTAREQAAAALEKKETVVMNNLPTGNSTTSTNNSEKTNSSGTTASPSEANQATALNSILKESEITAGQYQPVFDEFNKMTGRPTKELFDRVLSGQNPVAAAAQMASSALGEEGTKSLTDTALAIEEQVKNELSNKPLSALASSGFESTRKNSQSVKEDPLSNIQNMLAKLMPGQKPEEKAEEKKSLGKNSLVFNRVPAAAELGIHASNGASLFEIIGKKYQVVGPNFLEGRTIQGSLENVPKNIYLKK